MAGSVQINGLATTAEAPLTVAVVMTVVVAALVVIAVVVGVVALSFT